MIHDPKNCRLGRKPPRYDPRTLKLANYLPLTLPPIPPARQWSAKVSPPWGIMLNSELGDCTCAGAGHAIQTWTANATSEQTPPDDAILAAYEAVGGYVPGQPNTDNGCALLDVLNYWRQTGIGGHQIGAFVQVNPVNIAHVQAAIDLFGGLYCGANLPLSAQNQATWDVTADSPADAGSWGGHCIFVPDYDVETMTCVTWGALKTMTQAWWDAYVDECYAIITQDFLNQGTDPDGFNLSQLQADLRQVANDSLVFVSH